MKKIEVWRWLRSDKNYFEGVELLGKLCPNHPLLPSLQEDVSFMNRRYLEAAMKAVYDDFPTKQVSEASPSQRPTTKNDKKTALTDADFYRIAEKELAKAYQKRRDFSNKLHKCKSDEERAKISDAIKAKIREIGDLKARIGIFKETGKMPTKIESSHEVKVKLLSDIELHKKIQNFRAKVSVQKRIIENYDAQARKKSKAQHKVKLVELQKTLKKLNDERERRN